MSDGLSENRGGLSRRALLGYAAAGLAGGLVLPLGRVLRAAEASSSPSSLVFLRRTISSPDILDLFRLVGTSADGRVLVKVNVGVPGNPNALSPVLVRDLCERVNGTLGDSNAYEGPRSETQAHRVIAKERGFDFAPYDVLDADGSVEVPIEGGRHLQAALMGSHVLNYDSIIVVSHFTGDAMAGFSGAIKNVGADMASKEGRTALYGKRKGKPNETQTRLYLEQLAEYAKGMADARKGKMVYITILGNLSPAEDDDPGAPPPVMPDIGIVASTDAVAVESAGFDLVMNAARPVENELVQRMKRIYGYRQIDYGSEIKLGTSYSLVEI